MLFSLKLLFLFLSSFGLTGPPTDPPLAPTRLMVNQPAPSFSTTDVLGNPLSLEGLRGHKTLLSFMRDAGCPICELRLAHLATKSDSLKAANTRVVLIYESDAATMRRYLVDKDLPFTFVADPDGVLHDQFGVEKSLAKVALGFVKGVNKQIKAGKKLQTQDISREDAEKTRITADFILDENLLVQRAHYGRYLGDHLPL
jgi:thioredoxin-dependent peroxiredoxin